MAVNGGALRAPAVFVDKDGTLVRDVPFNVNPERIELLPGVASGMRALHLAGYRLVVVSNQPGVAMGLFTASELAGVEVRLSELLGHAGVPIDGYFWCTHAARSRDDPTKLACTCRKPMPGLLETAASLCDLDLERSWMIGDILDDRGGETEWKRGPYREPEAIVRRFDHAARIIVGAQAPRRACVATLRGVA